MVSRIAWAIIVLFGFAGCGPEVGNGVTDLAAICLEAHPGDVGCCPPGGHVDHGTCCPPNSHVVSDFEHPNWKICAWDADAGDAGADVQ